MTSLIRAYSSALKKYPTVMQSFQVGSLMGVGDLVSQFCVEGKSTNTYEWQRTARFFSIGFCLVGPAMKTWYGILDRQFGSATKVAAFKKVFVDQGIFAPCFTVGFLVTNYTLQFKPFAETKALIKRDYTDILIAGWMVWPAVQICNFSLVPLRHQVLFVQFFALFWNTYMAWKTNRDTTITVDDTPLIINVDDTPLDNNVDDTR